VLVLAAALAVLGDEAEVLGLALVEEVVDVVALVVRGAASARSIVERKCRPRLVSRGADTGPAVVVRARVRGLRVAGGADLRITREARPAALVELGVVALGSRGSEHCKRDHDRVRSCRCEA
jgi:hypothetical protein